METSAFVPSVTVRQDVFLHLMETNATVPSPSKSTLLLHSFRCYKLSDMASLWLRKPFHVLSVKELCCKIKCAAKSQNFDSGGLEL